jgi:tetratricopeptide (TPR) repeat protein
LRSTFEEEGLEKRPDQTRTESKTRLVEQIKIDLLSSDYSRALDLLRGTAAEFPNDGELSELEKLAQDGLNRRNEADRLITQSQELFSQQKPAKALQSLREAYELDRNNSLSRSILANALVEHAYSVVETDWWEAETLANEALGLNPAHPTAKTIHSRILDQKTTGSVEEWVSQTRKLQSSGNLSAALSQIAEGFAVYPRHPRLLQLQDAIQHDHSVQRRQARRRDLENLRSMESEIDAVAEDASKKALTGRIQAMTAKYSTDGEFLSVANNLLHRLGPLEVPQKSATVRDHDRATLIDNAASPKAPDVSLPATGLAPPIPIPPRNTPPGIVLPSIPLPSEVPLSVEPPGKVSTAPPKSVSSLQATCVPDIKHSAADAKVKSSSSQSKQTKRSNSATLILVSAAALIVIAWILFFARKHRAESLAKTPAATPNVSAPTVSTPTVSAPAISAPTVPTVSPRAVPVDTVSHPGPRTSEPSQPSAFMESGHGIETGHNIESSRNTAPSHMGAILVVANEDNASVFLNGKLQPQLTQAGQLLLPNLDVKNYAVQVSKSGFQDPPQQAIRIRNGEQAKLVFNLKPLPRFASLTIQGGIPGTTVLVDHTSVGTIQPDGTLLSDVSPGDHAVELRKDGFKPRQFEKHFVVGGAISLIAADAALEAALSELKINYAPPDAKVAIVKARELPMIVSSGVPLNVSAGTYTLTARTAESITRISTFEVVAGQAKTLDLSLAPSGMSKWDNAGVWKHEGDSFVCKGGEFVLYGVVPASGTFVFSAMPTKGRLLQWVLNYIDSKNYLLYQMDDDYFHRAVIRNGEKTDEVIVPDKGEKKSFRTLHIRVSPTEIVHQIRHGDGWKVLDRWTQPGANLSLGKFGIYIPGNDEVSLSTFAYYADLNIR